ncbi:hypothetical protein HGA91_00975 [candidate division WWE3 bacterium]|nr:hypothetical protein [candidate division WWE3 bacterium]
MTFGANFSISYCRWLAGEWGGAAVGQSWQNVLSQIIGMHPRILRVSVPWTELEVSPGVFDFSLHDYVVEQCRSANIQVILVIGIKNLRWPEVHIPEWHLLNHTITSWGSIPKHQLGVQEAFNNYVQSSVDHWSDHPAVDAIQIENEPFEMTGPGGHTISYTDMRDEVFCLRTRSLKNVAVTMGAGFTEPLLVAALTRRKILKRLLSLNPDLLGFNIYPSSERRVFNLFDVKNLAHDRHWRLLSTLIWDTKVGNATPFISELQAEPWESKPDQMDFSNPKGNRSFTIDMYRELLYKIAQFDFEFCLLWGLEFQAACMNQGNPSWWKCTQEWIGK